MEKSPQVIPSSVGFTRKRKKSKLQRLKKEKFLVSLLEKNLPFIILRAFIFVPLMFLYMAQGPGPRQLALMTQLWRQELLYPQAACGGVSGRRHAECGWIKERKRKEVCALRRIYLSENENEKKSEKRKRWKKLVVVVVVGVVVVVVPSCHHEPPTHIYRTRHEPSSWIDYQKQAFCSWISPKLKYGGGAHGVNAHLMCVPDWAIYAKRFAAEAGLNRLSWFVWHHSPLQC